jgi:hypothetical protein
MGWLPAGWEPVVLKLGGDDSSGSGGQRTGVNQCASTIPATPV